MKQTPQTLALARQSSGPLQPTGLIGHATHLGKRAFTLLEIMVVVVIIGIVAGIAVSQLDLRGQSDKAKKTATRVNLQRVAGSVETYYVEFSKYPTMQQLISENYLKSEIKDAWGGPITIDPQTGKVTAKGPGEIGIITSDD